jgi:hypothetical protein
MSWSQALLDTPLNQWLIIGGTWGVVVLWVLLMRLLQKWLDRNTLLEVKCRDCGFTATCPMPRSVKGWPECPKGHGHLISQRIIDVA